MASSDRWYRVVFLQANIRNAGVGFLVVNFNMDLSEHIVWFWNLFFYFSVHLQLRQLENNQYIPFANRVRGPYDKLRILVIFFHQRRNSVPYSTDRVNEGKNGRVGNETSFKSLAGRAVKYSPQKHILKTCKKISIG